MNEHTIAKNVIMKQIFSMLSILCEKLPLESSENASKTIPTSTIGARTVEWKSVAKTPTIITPTATNEVK